MTKVFESLLPQKSSDLAASPLFDLFARHLTAVNEFCSIIYLPLDGGVTAPDDPMTMPSPQGGSGGAGSGAAGGGGGGSGGLPAPGGDPFSMSALAGLLAGPGMGGGGGLGMSMGGMGGGAGFDQKSLAGFGGGPQQPLSAQQQNFLNSFFSSMGAPHPGGSAAASGSVTAAAAGVGLPPFGLAGAKPGGLL